MHPLSQEQNFNVKSEDDFIEFLIEPTLVVNTFFKVTFNISHPKYAFRLLITFSDGKENIDMPFDFRYSPTDVKYMITAESEKNEQLLATSVKVRYIEASESGNIENGDISIIIQAFHLSEEERASYKKDGLSTLGK